MIETRELPKPLEVWRHCKGNSYEIVALALHTERGDEELVIYRRADIASMTWARPVSMFMGRHDSGTLRFERISTVADGFRNVLARSKEAMRELRAPQSMPYDMPCVEIALPPSE